jgi:hypothetical protein
MNNSQNKKWCLCFPNNTLKTDIYLHAKDIFFWEITTKMADEFFITETSFVLLSVNCLDWKDPDGDTEAFIYRYETVTRRKLSHGPEDIVNFVYEGSKFELFPYYLYVLRKYKSHVCWCPVTVKWASLFPASFRYGQVDETIEWEYDLLLEQRP